MGTIDFENFNEQLIGKLYRKANAMYTVGGRENLLQSNDIVKRGVSTAIQSILKSQELFRILGTELEKTEDSGSITVGYNKLGFCRIDINGLSLKGNDDSLSIVGLTAREFYQIIISIVDASTQVHLGNNTSLISVDGDLKIIKKDINTPQQ